MFSFPLWWCQEVEKAFLDNMNCSKWHFICQGPFIVTLSEFRILTILATFGGPSSLLLEASSAAPWYVVINSCATIACLVNMSAFQIWFVLIFMTCKIVFLYCFMVQSGYGLSLWETMCQSDVFYWLSPYTEWSLLFFICYYLVVFLFHFAVFLFHFAIKYNFYGLHLLFNLPTFTFLRNTAPDHD